MGPIRTRLLIAPLLTLLPVAAWGLAPKGWTQGTVAAGTQDALAPVPPTVVTMDAAIAARITGPTAVFYFSPTCPHCQHVGPEVAALAGRDLGVSWLGVATGNSEQADIDAFVATYAIPFPVVTDETREFSLAMQARSTPGLYLMEPAPSAFQGVPQVAVTEAYTPFRRGAGALFAMRRHPQAPYQDFQGYQGIAACVSCHTEEATSWALTLHSRAYATLALREKVDDAECVRCHVTGMGEGGFELGDHGSPLANVTCEACHGASGPHDGAPTDARSTCVGCHDAEHSVAFTVEKGLPHIDHHVSTTLTEEEITKRLMALQAGEAERPLLAFPEGATVGAGACKECHTDSHRGWKKGGHAKAMRHLQGPDASDPSCVRCHATPAAYPIGTDFREEEGVSCESCHGAGGAHIAAPSTENIVGLGESCPECVIESICTQCHTPKWDADWNLTGHLQDLRH